MKLFLVIQVGVYRHDIRGVFSTLDGADHAARRAAREDSDSYHDYEVHESTLDEYANDVLALEISYDKRNVAKS